MNPRLLMLLWPYDDDFDLVYEAGIVVPDKRSLQFTMPVGRLHYTVTPAKVHHVIPVGRMHKQLVGV